jgi:Family of unknown function (DUF6200)
MATTAITPTEVKASGSSNLGASASPIVLDLGKHRRKAVRALRKGGGKLMGEVSAALDELRSSGAVSTSAQPIIIIVQQKRRRATGFSPRF